MYNILLSFYVKTKQYFIFYYHNFNRVRAGKYVHVFEVVFEIQCMYLYLYLKELKVVVFVFQILCI